MTSKPSTPKRVTPHRIIGIDLAKPGGDYSCKVWGKRLADGTIEIERVRYYGGASSGSMNRSKA